MIGETIMIRRFFKKDEYFCSLTTDNKTIILDKANVTVTDLTVDEFTKKLDELIDTGRFDDPFFESFENYDLEDHDSTYFDDSEYRTDILDTILYWFSRT